MPDYYPPPKTFSSWQSLTKHQRPMQSGGTISMDAPLPGVGLTQGSPGVQGRPLAFDVMERDVVDIIEPEDPLDQLGPGDAGLFQNGEAPPPAGPSPVVIGVGLLAVGAAAWYFLR